MTAFNVKTAAALSVFLLAAAHPAFAQLAPDDCSRQSVSGQPTGVQSGGGQAARGPSRKALKLRTADAGKGYTKYNRGKPITIDEWFRFTCGLDGLAPKEIPADTPIRGAETVRVTLRGYVLAARFMREGDQQQGASAASDDSNPSSLSKKSNGMSHHAISDVPGL